MKNYFKPGDWNAICDVCGFKFKGSQLMRRWDGAMVCHADFELRHPQDLIRIPTDNPSTSWSRPEPTDVFITIGDFLMTEASDSLFTEEGSFIETET
jgi:hypothetical protein